MTSESESTRTKHRIASVDEFTEEGDRIIEEIGGQEIAVFYIDGDYHAVANYCVHQGGPLCEGGLTGRTGVGADGWQWTFQDEGEIITCPWHHWQFDVTTGASVASDRYAVPTYDIQVEDGEIYVLR
jgi:nitrite reductase/ring-hydroxylating ferredoxin subunit